MSKQVRQIGCGPLLVILCGWAFCASGNEITAVVAPRGETSDAKNPTLDFAARELSHYLKEMTGKDYPLMCAREQQTPAAVQLAVDSSLAEDEYWIRRVDFGVEIVGGNARGCLYGAYGFLRALGCRWPLPGKAYEVIPRRTAIDFSGPDIRSKPAIKHRGILWALMSYDEDLLEIVDYLAKNGFNFMLIHGGPIPSDYLVKLDESLRARDMGVEWGGHFMPGYLPRSEFEHHPEYFRMENGQRTPSLNMCPSSSEAADIVAKKSLADWTRLKTLSRFEMLHMWPDDLDRGGWCSCPLCAGLSDSDQALKMLNAVAERLPLGQTAIAHLSYHATAQCPKTIKPHPNVRLFYSPRERCYHHAMGECEANRRYLDWLKPQIQWFPNEPEVFDYCLDLILFRMMPMPLHPVIGRDVKVYREIGIDRITNHAFQRYSEWAYGVNYYVLGKSLWRGEGSPDDIQEYCQAMYGPRAETMRQYFDALFELCATAMETCGYEGFADMRVPPDEAFTATHAAQLAPLVAKEHLDAIENLIEKAAATAAEPYRTRIDQQIVLWKVARHECQAIFQTLVAMQHMRAFRAGQMNQADRLQTIKVIEEAIAHINENTAILTSTPESLRGPHVFGNMGVKLDRLQTYLSRPQGWLKELQQAPSP